MHLKIVYFLYSKKDYSEIHRYTFLISRYSQVNCRLNSVMCWSKQQSRACGKCNPQEGPLKNTFRDLVHVLSLTIYSIISCLLPWLIISLAQPVHWRRKRFVTEPFVEPRSQLITTRSNFELRFVSNADISNHQTNFYFQWRFDGEIENTLQNYDGIYQYMW